jgi:predicted ABC-type ATPase
LPPDQPRFVFVPLQDVQDDPDQLAARLRAAAAAEGITAGGDQHGVEWFHPGHASQKVHGRRKGAGGGGRPGMGDIPVDDRWVAGFQGGSAAPHLRRQADGSMAFTPERQALHDRIVNDTLAGKRPPPAGQQPVYHIMGGGPASGKTSLLDTPEGAAMRDPDVALIGLDDLRAELPGYQAALKTPAGPSGFHEEAAYLTARTTTAAAERGLSLTLDTTGDSSTSVLRGRVLAAKRAGYRVEGHYVTIPIDTAIERAEARGRKIGRFVPTAGLTVLHAHVSRSLPAVTRDFDAVDLYDNRGPMGSTPKRVMSWDGQRQTIDSPRLWQEFLDKSKASPAGTPVPTGAWLHPRAGGGSGGG